MAPRALVQQSFYYVRENSQANTQTFSTLESRNLSSEALLEPENYLNL